MVIYRVLHLLGKWLKLRRAVLSGTPVISPQKRPALDASPKLLLEGHVHFKLVFYGNFRKRGHFQSIQGDRRLLKQS
jgi:hypothetical protein